jgi:PAS domain S-box-containing protein
MIRAKTAPSKAEKHRLELAAVVSSSSDAILATDLTGIVEAWNKGAQDLYGYTAGDMIGQTIATVIPEHLHEEHLHLCGI